MAAAPLIMLGLGVGQGVMSYQAGRNAAEAAEINAQHARDMQKYEQSVKESNIALIQEEEKQAKERQEYTNAAVMGSVTAQMGASGVQTTGSFMDVLAEQVILGQNKNSMIRSKSLRQQTGASNAGDLAIYQQEYAEYSYLRAAQDAKRKATMGLIMGVGGGMVGFAQAGGVQAGGGLGSLFGNLGSLFNFGGGGGQTLLSQASGELGLDDDPFTDYFASLWLAP